MSDSFNFSRRDFLKTASAATAGLMLGGISAAEESKPEKWVFDHRVQFGAWINDMRNEALPRDQWPSQRLDEDTERDIIDCLELGRKSGFNQVDIWGLFATSSYPVDIRSAFTDAASPSIRTATSGAYPMRSPLTKMLPNR